ncbi:40-residue YVTN family beta-propeller repeat-containing protein [Nakamurella panacisegetis]|uniref:40-residue YVTN family beta-propeller repeat-containing protein n=1 Tax=Nakamurella panacisegetis TaxID=1090615 RepID=A0A1H0IQ82_9ACTN|nr:40-residue YVTN family beta-propeller repeat-containing protein [Nakamurella panacisegetis]
MQIRTTERRNRTGAQRLAWLVAAGLLMASCTSAGAKAQESAVHPVTTPESTTATALGTRAAAPGSGPSTPSTPASSVPGRTPPSSPGRIPLSSPHPTTKAGAAGGLPGMPPVADPHNVYADAAAGRLSAAVAGDPPYAYVPHNRSGDVWVIDQRTHAVIRKCHVGIEIQHVVPSYDLTKLYATDDVGNHIRVIDPRTGECGREIPVKDPYNMYFTPDGRYAISVAEEYRQLIWYDPVTWKVHDTTSIPGCAGIDHADFSPDGRTAVFTCEFAGRVAVVDIVTHRVERLIDMPVRNTMMGPQDIKLAPDGSAYYIADSDSNGVWVLDGAARKVLRHIATGRGAHGLYLSRDASELYVTNRLAGTISVLNSRTGALLTTWVIPGGGSPDMGNVSADGSQLWVSGRYNSVVYVFDTRNGHLLARIPVGDEPHGLALMPIPGRYSLGHTGITR